MPLRPFQYWLATLAVSVAMFLFWPVPRAFFGVAVIAHIPLLAWGIANPRLQFFCPTLCRKKGEETKIALTFDDGPDPRLTPDVLDILQRYGMRATFFVVARNVRNHPALVRRTFDEGHGVACHDLNHSVLSNFRLKKRMIAEIGEAQNSIAEVIGRTPLLYRPPVGLTNPHLAPALAHLRMRCIGWSRQALDAGNRNGNRLKKIEGLAAPGEVVLLHDTLPVAKHKALFLSQLDSLCKDIQQRGLKAVRVDELFLIPGYEGRFNR